MRLVKVVTLATIVLAWVPAHAQSFPCATEGSYGYWFDPTLKLRNLGAPDGDDTVTLQGILPIPDGSSDPAWESFDPATTGLALRIFRFVQIDGEYVEELLLDVRASAGAQWVSAPDGRGWTYRALDRQTRDIKRAVLRAAPPNPAYPFPHQYKLSIEARRGSFGPVSDLDHHWVQVAFSSDEPTYQCAYALPFPRLVTYSTLPPGENTFEAPEWATTCRLKSDSRTLTCTNGPRFGPCHVSHPNHLARCEIFSAAAAQERFRASMGSYYRGSCDELPGFVPTTGVYCLTSPSPTGFSVRTWHGGMNYTSGCSFVSGLEPHCI
jgi:hypothetical protein